MRLLGIDYGTKKVGFALTDERGVMAFPHAVVPNNAKLMKYIERLVESEKVGKIIIGHSLNQKGSPNAVHEGAEALMLDITLNLGIPVDLEPEQYTTQEAMRLQGQNAKTDAAAATIILNSYLTKRKQ